MELSFAIKTIKAEKEMNLYGNGYFICDTKAIDTVLEALDSKDRMIKLLIADLQSEGYLNMSLEEIMRYYQNRKDEV